MVNPQPSLTPTDIYMTIASPSWKVSLTQTGSTFLPLEDVPAPSVSPESDRDEAEDRPLSRRLLLYTAVVRAPGDGDVDIWEGLVETTDDEALEEPPEFPLRPSPLSQSSFSLTDVHSAEERRVEDALNQSMVSTLSTSRASSESASGITNHPPSRARDLRLSFPDPLSGSKDDLLRSHEVLCSSPTTVDPPQLSELSDDEEPPNTPISSPSYLKLPTAEFEIYLYGTPPQRKWSIIESLLEKWGDALNFTVSKRHSQYKYTSTYWLHPKGNLHRLSLGYAVSVIDNTEAQSLVGVIFFIR